MTGPTTVPDRPQSVDDLGYRAPIACRAAGITYRQCDYWARTGLVEPSLRDAHGSGTQRLYAVHDIVLLRVVKKLLDAGISLQNVRRTVAFLPLNVDDLADLTIASDGATVWPLWAADDAWKVLQSGDAMYAIAVGKTVSDVLATVAVLLGERALAPLQVVS